MPERAMYVVMDDDGWLRFTSRWRAPKLDLDLIGGPVAALQRIRDQEKTYRWYNDTWCEAAALIDQPNKILFFFTRHCEDYAHRAAVLSTLGLTWPAWDVRWAYDGIADIRAYLGLEYSEAPTGHAFIEPSPAEGGMDQLVSVTREDGTTDAYGLELPVTEMLTCGPDCADLLPASAKVTACEWMPRSGVHIDHSAKTIGVWTIDSLSGLADAVAWPGWKVEMWADRYTEQLDRCGVTVPDWSLADGLRTLAARVRNGTDLHHSEPR
ncbi:hypothetical protein [Actinocrispum sp. NPDC049592]|uniref:hypothetical protein n=1 Tax=Actinocrispum sp. NPDC049592 TaxID=3154835 RepID=UPI0034178FE1